jgi:N-acetylmuramoyl-L-alanine amidase
MRSGIFVLGAVLAVASTAVTRLDLGAEVQSREIPTPAVVPATVMPVVGEAPPAPVPVMWERPAGPLRIALQAGHWKAAEAPDEQAGLRDNGTRGGGKAEWQVNLDIATRTAAILEEAGYAVEILPTTIPPGYWADLFVSIHADGHPSPSTSGYRAAAPRRDVTGKAAQFAAILERTYGEATGLRKYPTVTRRMTGYYAFNWRRYQHALHPMTVGVIIETGFLTSPRDRRIIVDSQDRPARGIAEAIQLFGEQLVLDSQPVPMPTIVRAPPRPRGPRESSD